MISVSGPRVGVVAAARIGSGRSSGRSRGKTASQSEPWSTFDEAVGRDSPVYRVRRGLRVRWISTLQNLIPIRAVISVASWMAGIWESDDEMKCMRPMVHHLKYKEA